MEMLKKDVVSSLQLLRYGEKALPAFTFHVSRYGANRIGLDLFHNLGLLDTNRLRDPHCRRPVAATVACIV